MKLWCVNFHASHEGMMLSWHARKEDAEKVLKQWNRDFDIGGTVALVQVNIPTSSRAELASWLNTYYNRDNG